LVKGHCAGRRVVQFDHAIERERGQASLGSLSCLGITAALISFTSSKIHRSFPRTGLLKLTFGRGADHFIARGKPTWIDFSKIT
jgi:hypothetical protein